MRILRDDSVLMLVDLQERLYAHIAEKDALLKNTALLLSGLKVLNVPIIVTEQYTKGLGKTLPELAEILSDFEPLEKTAFSCLDDSAISGKLKTVGRRTILLAGIETHVCILQTAVDLAQQGYLPVIITDCVSSRSLFSKETALKRLAEEGAVLTSVESILFELLRYSGTEVFRSISKLVK